MFRGQYTNTTNINMSLLCSNVGLGTIFDLRSALPPGKCSGGHLAVAGGLEAKVGASINAHFLHFVQ